MGKILLFYQYVHITYPEQIAKWQRRICHELGLTGRIILAHEGINGTVGGSDEATDAYRRIMKEHELFATMDIKDSAGSAADFPRLAVMIKREICQLGVDPDDLTVADGGVHLDPAEAHALMANPPKDLIILDTRNRYEWEVGAFEGAIKPDIQTFREFPQYIDEHLEEFRGKEVLMYCTGGVRCERATAYLNRMKIAKTVYQIRGGIHRYAEQFPNGFFRGKNYVFDKRIAVPVNDDILGKCMRCHAPYDTHRNCLAKPCIKQILLCDACIKVQLPCCSAECLALVQGQSSVPANSCAFSTRESRS